MGAAAGASETTTAVLLCIFVSGVNVVLRPIVSMLARHPAPKTDEPTVYSVHVSCAGTDAAREREILIRLVETTGLPLRAIRTGEPNERGMVEVAAELLSSGGPSDELATLADHLGREPLVPSARCQLGGFGGATTMAAQS
jgi:putative Mg2+ transporter-C (MgtC) family protein